MKELFFQPVSKVSTIISDGMRKSIKNGATAEYNIDSELSLVGRADAIADDIVIKFEVVDKLPKLPDPEGLLNLNATMWVFDEMDGIIVYMTNDGKSVEFAFTKDKQM